MKKIVKILILCLSCMGACWLLPACSSAIEEPESGGRSDGSTVTLTIQAAVPDGTRADGSEVPDREKIDHLKIIVVDQTTHKVEHNQLHGFSYPEDEYNIEVVKNSTKDVYFLANAESWCSDFPKVGEIYNPDEDESEGDEGDGGIIEARTTTMPSLFNQEITDLPENLPYTSKYEIEVKDKNVAAICYIAIAAVKFDIVFNNNTNNEIEVKSLDIGGIANQSYLFPHNEEWNKWVESLTGSGSKDYFTDYDIPKNTVHGNYLVPIPSTSGNDGTQGNAGDGSENSSFTVSVKNDSEPGSGSYTIPTFYCHESKNETESNKQQYFIQFEIDDKVFISEIKTGSEFLASLIRSTHVKITVNINSLEQKDEDIIISGEIVDWNWLEEVTGDIEEVEEQSES